MSAPTTEAQPGPGTPAARSLRAARGAHPTGALAAGAAALGAWAGTAAKDYEVVAQQRDADGPMVDRALEIVQKFIADRDLILFGGLAVDYALRLKGDRLYPDGQRPDFDVLSVRSVEDAYDLADILRAAGFEGVGAVRAIHVQTMKVRTDFIWVADIGYAPPAVFARIPTFNYQGMRVVHPDFQRMDMHLAFCFPFNGPPREDVFHRWRKDLARFNLFERYYPIAAAAAAAAARPASVMARLAVPLVGRGPDLRVALHGFAAYAAIRAAFDELAAALGGAAPPAVAAPRLALAFPDAHSVAVETPVGDTVALASPWPAEAVAGLPGAAGHFAPYMDVRPESYRVGGAVVLSTRGRRLAASLVRAPGAAGQAYVVTPQYLLLWLLCEAHRAADEGAALTYRAYYAHTLEILNAAEEVYARLHARAAAEPRGAQAARAALDSFAQSPFAPTLTTLGDLNLDAAYIIKMASNASRLRDTPPAALHLDPGIATLLEGLPSNYYPATAKQRPTFAYAGPLFCREGQPI